jgi:phage terminase small subunit
MARKRSPTLTLIQGGKSKRSKAELKARADNEIKLGDKKIVPTASVKSDKVALKMWNHIAKINADNDYVTSADTGIIEQYCLAYSDYQDLIISRKDFKKDNDKKRGKEKLKSYEVMKELKGIDKMTNEKSALLTKLGDKLMLDPRSRISAKPIEKKDKPKSILDELEITG